MSRIKGRDTAPEIRIRKILFAKGIKGYRINYPIPGKPDIVFPKKRMAVFIDGCFWHRCPLCFIEPQTKKEFWAEKIEKNVARDREVSERLTKDGWKVLRFWEHDVKKDPQRIAEKIAEELKTDNFRCTWYGSFFTGLFRSVPTTALESISTTGTGTEFPNCLYASVSDTGILKSSGKP